MLDTPLSELVPPEWLADRIAEGMLAVSRDHEARDAFVSRVNAQRARLAGQARPLRSWMPQEAHAPLRTLLSRPWSPSEALTLRIINHPALRSLVRDILKSTLTRFTSRIKSLDQGVLGGLGGRAVRRGRGLFGGVADGLVGAVREEMGAAVEGRIVEFLGTATEEAVRGIAAWVSNPDHADALAAMRLSALDVLLDTPLRDLSRETESIEAGELVDLVLDALREAGARDDLRTRLAEVTNLVLEQANHPTLRPLLEEFSILSTWEEAVLEWLSQRVVAIADSDDFATWWEALHA
jgi:hypothetical protein